MKRVVIAVVVVCLFASRAHAQQAKITWADGFPKPGANQGQIDVKGIFRPDPGWTIASCNALAWPVGSGPMAGPVVIPINVNTGIFEGTIPNLTPNQEYNVLIQCLQNMGATTKIILSDPGKARAKQ